MANYTLKEVTDKKEIISFLELPVKIYKEDKNWIRPLDNDIEAVFSPEKNKLLKGGEIIRWIAYDNNNEVVGRIAAFYNTEQANKGDVAAGGCGFFESINDKELAYKLFDAAKGWLISKGMKAMDGPINFGNRDYFWGLLVEGFYEPVYNMNYNHQYYEEFFDSYGFQNYFNQLSYIKYFREAEALNPIIEEKARRLKESGEYLFRAITKEDLPYIGDWFRGIYNAAWANFEGVDPMTKEESDSLFKELKPVIDKKLITFAFHKGVAIGFYIMIPNLYQAIKHLGGKFNLWAKLKFLYHLKIKKSCNIIYGLIFGVNPAYQGKGIESGIINLAKENIVKYTKYTHMELVWMGDFNPLMIRMVESYVQAKKYKRHVTYRYMLDETIEFKRCPRASVARKAKVKE